MFIGYKMFQLQHFDTRRRGVAFSSRAKLSVVCLVASLSLAKPFTIHFIHHSSNPGLPESTNTFIYRTHILATLVMNERVH